MNKGFSRIGKLVVNQYIFPDDLVVERDPAGPQLVLKVFRQLQLPLHPTPSLSFPGSLISVLFSALVPCSERVPMGTCPQLATFDPINKTPVHPSVSCTNMYPIYRNILFDHGAHAGIPPQHKDNRRIIR